MRLRALGAWSVLVCALGCATTTDPVVHNQVGLRDVDGVALGMVSSPERIYPDVLFELLQAAEPLLDAGASKRQLGEYLFASGTYLIVRRNYPAAVEYLQRSMAAWPHSANPASAQLESLEEQLGR